MNELQRIIYDASRVLLWPVLVATVICFVWVLIELGFLLYELWLRFRYRDLDALEARTLKARKAFEDGKPRTAYRYLQENNYSIVVSRFLFDLIRNYQTERLAAKPLKLLQEYEFYTLKRLERTRILVRVGPMLGLMGTLIPLSPALLGLATGHTTNLLFNITTAFSVTVIGLLIGGLAFVISIVRDRMYAQDVSDMEYLLELLEGGDGRLHSGRRRDKKGVWDSEPEISYDVADADVGIDTDIDKTQLIPTLLETPSEPLIPGVSGNNGVDGHSGGSPAVVPVAIADSAGAAPPLTFDDPAMDWKHDEDPFADLGPVDAAPPASGEPAPGVGDATRSS